MNRLQLKPQTLYTYTLRPKPRPTLHLLKPPYVSLNTTTTKCTTHPSKPQPPPATTLPFWTCRHTWSRSAINTLRCLIGCTTGDFTALWTLQAYAPDWGMPLMMGVSMTTGLLTSLTLETVLLAYGKDALPLRHAVRTAAGMSLVSMLAMESVQNAVDWHLTGGVVDVADWAFWGKAGVSMAAGFAAPLPWNYWRLRALGVGCH
ncbi:hypothetical protein P168DRAFT_324425 [Aspergillus campestris IBT 28561]|uniref:DUF4396 domain-containing protein n=1 Tax=Aspergillus campestris (strain IBT 28561) TaxID=1392248 RepID=A0A2I1DAQ5_ASPC2|nr:uncharacterized protein P168DRAFT_324425 [Aspergillus campestris IBT 28561]PKY06958.1 hypothetical protein P168DRAFT_324425 [Aspergillus campestris IBT 28561]